MDDLEYPGDEAAANYDFLGFEERDSVDDFEQRDLRFLTTGLPARPGTRRSPLVARRLG